MIELKVGQIWCHTQDLRNTHLITKIDSPKKRVHFLFNGISWGLPFYNELRSCSYRDFEVWAESEGAFMKINVGEIWKALNQ